MTELRKFNPDVLMAPAGFRNIGFTCYYNSLIQSLMSCSSFVELITQDRDDKFLAALNKAIKDPATIPYTWSILMQSIIKKSPSNAYFTSGQQCAAELYSLMLDAIENEYDIQELFTYRRQNEIFCPACKQIYSSVTETNNIFDVNVGLELGSEFDKTHLVETKTDVPCGTQTNCTSIESFLLRHFSDVDEDAVCTLCGVRGHKQKTSRLRLAPEILFINVKQYRCKDTCQKIKSDIQFPEWISFESVNTKLRYRTVAYIQHYGGVNGGHYTATALRNSSDKKLSWYNFDDQSVSVGSFAPNENTYCILYHYYDSIPN